MVSILSQTGRNLLLQLPTGFFLDRTFVGPNESEILFVVKVPFEIIAAVRHGAKLFLWTGPVGRRNEEILAATFTVEDDPEAPFVLSRTVSSEQAQLLRDFFKDGRGRVCFFDELDRALLSLQVSLAEQPYLVAAIALLDVKWREPEEATANAALDEIDALAATKSDSFKKLYLQCSNIRQVSYLSNNYYLIPPVHGAARYGLTTHLDQEAGGKLEERVSQVLRQLFPAETVFLSPVAGEGDSDLCDVLLGSPCGYLFLECKAAAINATALHRKPERRLAGLKKQFKKGLSQIEGVRRRVLSHRVRTIDTRLGKVEIESHRHELLHFGIIMSEIHPDFAELHNYQEQGIVAAEKRNTALHLLDVQELLKLIHYSKSSEQFFANLEHRWRTARERRTLVLSLECESRSRLKDE